MLFQVKSSAYEALKAGQYPCVFKGVSEVETTKGAAYRFDFLSDDGKKIGGFGGDVGQSPTLRNKLGRWLCALAGRSVSEGSVNVADYVGKRYVCLINADGKLETFTLLG